MDLITIKLPTFCLVLLIGPSGSGKSTFASRHFRKTEVVSADTCRALVSDDKNNQTVTEEAFEVLHLIVAKRLAKRRLTVVDATNVQTKARLPLLRLARKHDCPVVALVFKIPLEICLDHNQLRRDRHVPEEAISRQYDDMLYSLGQLDQEGYHQIYTFRSVGETDDAVVERIPG
jgi:protein phosphatase